MTSQCLADTRMSTMTVQCSIVCHGRSPFCHQNTPLWPHNTELWHHNAPELSYYRLNWTNHHFAITMLNFDITVFHWVNTLPPQVITMRLWHHNAELCPCNDELWHYRKYHCDTKLNCDIIKHYYYRAKLHWNIWCFLVISHSSNPLSYCFIVIPWSKFRWFGAGHGDAHL